MLAGLLTLAAIPVINPSVCYAAEHGKLTKSDLNIMDTSHGFYFYVYYNGSKCMLNQYVDGFPRSGIKVSTWSPTGDITQAWDTRTVKKGGWIVTTNNRRNLVLNILRTSATPEVNIYPYIDNDYDDFVLIRDTLKLKNRNYGVTRTNVRTPDYNVSGYICRWTSNWTNWSYDV